MKFGVYINLNWATVLVPWYIQSALLLLFGFIMLIMTIVFIIANKPENAMIKNAFCILTPLILYFAISSFNVIHGFKLNFHDGEYFLLYGNGYFMFIGGFIILLICSFLFFKFIHHINALVKKNQAESFSLTKFAKNVKLEMQPVSGHYFKKKEENKNFDLKKSIIKLEECTICCEKQGEILIKPCGHSGICKECILKCLENNILCPSCRKEIKEVLVLEYDEEKKEYMATGNIELKKK